MLNKLSKALKILPALLIGLGLLIVAATLFRAIPDFLIGLTRSLKHPTTYDFPAYERLLKSYVKDGYVDYKGSKGSKDLEDAVRDLESVASDKMVDRKEQLCYWINSYNLLTIKMICDRYPIRNIRQVQLDRTGKQFTVGGKTISLQNIQNQYINPLLADRRTIPETAFLVCNGTVSYPPLTDHVLNAKDLDTDARVACFKFINDERNVFFDPETRNFYLSPVFRRYEPVLTKVGRTPHEFAVAYIADETKRPRVGQMLMLQTFFQKVNNTINDKALEIRKAPEE